MEEKKSMIVGYMKKYLRPVVLTVFIALAIEIFVFNFRSVQSIFYKEVNVPVDGNKITGMKYFGEGVFKFIDDDVVGMSVVKAGQTQSELEYGTGKGVDEDGNAVRAVYLTGLDELIGNMSIHNIRLDVETPDAMELPFMESGVLYVKTHIKDEGNEFFETLPQHSILQSNEVSKYIYMQPSGRVSAIVTEFSLSNGQIMVIKSITLNAHRPISFSFYRFLILLLAGGAVFAFRPASALWQIKAVDKAPWKKLVVAVLCIIYIMPAWILIRDNTYLTNFVNFNPYQELAVALAEGHFYINEEPEPSLVSLLNPYDDSLRTAMNIEPKWDYALYNGKYYVYFGIVPCLIFYFPLYALFGINMPNSLPVLAAAVFLFIGIYMLINAMASVYCPKLKYATHLILTTVVYFGCQMPFFLNQPDGYAVPVACAEAMLVWSLYFWMSSLKSEGWAFFARVAVGSFIMALIVGTRPNMGIYILLAVPIFVHVMVERQKKDAQELKCRIKLVKFIMALVLPFIPMAVGLMYYNASRFGSVFDFGNNYNLTVSDVSLNPFSIDKMIIGIYEYLLKLPDLTYHFPFMSIPGDGTEKNAIGHCFVHMEYIFSGLIPVNILLWSIPILFSGKGNSADKSINKIRHLGISFLILGVFLILFDSETAGIVYRYEADFSLALLIAGAAAVMVWIRKADGYDGNGKIISEKMIYTFLIAALIWSIIYHFNFYMLTGLKYPLLWGNTELYYKVFYAINFL